MIKDYKLICDYCGYVFATITPSGTQIQLHVNKAGLTLNVKPEDKENLYASCPKCGKETSVQRSLFGVS